MVLLTALLIGLVLFNTLDDGCELMIGASSGSGLIFLALANLLLSLSLSSSLCLISSFLFSFLSASNNTLSLASLELGREVNTDGRVSVVYSLELELPGLELELPGLELELPGLELELPGLELELPGLELELPGLELELPGRELPRILIGREVLDFGLALLVVDDEDLRLATGC